MLVIRKEQMDVLDQYMLNTFENLLVDHLNRYFPEKCGELGEEGLRETIRYGIKRAEDYGIVIEHQVSLYINLMFMFNRDFDQDPALPWASEILLDPSLKGTSAKMETLYREAERHLP